MSFFLARVDFKSIEMAATSLLCPAVGPSLGTGGELLYPSRKGRLGPGGEFVYTQHKLPDPYSHLCNMMKDQHSIAFNTQALMAATFEMVSCLVKGEEEWLNYERLNIENRRASTAV